MTTLQSVQTLLQANFDLAPEALRPDARLADLAIDSLSVIELLFAVEDAFKVKVPPEPAALQTQLTTVGDLVAYVKRVGAQDGGRVRDAVARLLDPERAIVVRVEPMK